MTLSELLDAYYLEMRWRCLSLAADLDRLDRAGTGSAADARVAQLRQAIAILLQDKPGRAARVQTLLSDQTPPPR